MQFSYPVLSASICVYPRPLAGFRFMKSIAFITPLDAAYGLGLSGVSQYAVETGDAEQTLLKAMAEQASGLIVIDERFLTVLPEDKLRELEQAWNGVLLVLPSPEKPSADVEDYAARLIRRAIGYHVRLNV
jgi:vacuolar-type H+-ATPase subunit F/Vma7